MPDTEIRTWESTRGALPPPVPASAVCANCAAPLTGPYCANCGQHVADFHRSVWRFVADFFDNTICWDNKLFRTLEPLFKQPGFLTREFMVGRRVRYVHPLRLFLFTSAVCLALLKYDHSMHQSAAHTAKVHKARKSAQIRFDDAALPASTPDAAPTSAESPTAALTKKAANETAGAEAGKDADDGNLLGQAIQRAVAENLPAANKGGKVNIDEAVKKLEGASDKIESASGKMTRAADNLADAGGAERLSWVALALLPVFALGLRTLYRRNERFYFEHLIFSLHYHVFLLLFWTGYVGVLLVASWLPLHGFFESIVRLGLLLPPVYLYVALRRIYGEGTKRTVFKTLLLGSMHLLAIVIGVEAVGAAAIL